MAKQTGFEGLEHILGKGLIQPFANTNSGSRKLMYSVHIEQALPMMEENAEVPIVSTGYENRYGDLSSSIVKAQTNFEVIAKISKFYEKPNQCYLLITKRLDNGQYDVIERKPYNHIGETYGYLYNNRVIDNLDIGFEVPKDKIIRKSCAYDHYMNRRDGVNLLIGYISSDKDMEDGIVLSEEAVEKLKSPLIKRVTIFIGENDILLNLYGDDTYHKSFPDIMESVKDGILCASRKEKIEECLYMQSVDRLTKILMSDEKFTVEDTVLDINVYSNNPMDLEDRHTNSQVLYYYREHIRYIKEIVNTIDSLRDVNGNIDMSYDLQRIYYTAKYELSGMLFEKDKKYEGTILEIYLLEKNIPSVGDKMTNRYGGKGVISYILPKEEMPLLEDGRRLEAYLNSCTCVNRLNEGQLDEMSLTFIGSRILQHIMESDMCAYEAISEIYKFMYIVSPEEATEFWNMMYNDNITEEDREWYIDDMLEDGNILISNKPISESMTLDKLAMIYREFPYIKQYRTVSKMIDSAGKERYVLGRRRITAGKVYFIRLKQYAEDKFSATSLSSTNLTNENTKSKASKNYMAVCANTPIRFGEMESEDERHMGTEVVVHNLMVHSTSPQARRLTEEFIEGDPYTIDIKLDGTCKSRSAEKAKVYLKAMGYAIKIFKRKKKTENLFSPIMPEIPQEDLFSHSHPDENKNGGKEWFTKLKNLETVRKKRLFSKDLFKHIDKSKN